MASHSLYALGLPDATYHELGANYLGASMRRLGLLGGWHKEKPSTEPFEVRKQDPADTKGRTI